MLVKAITRVRILVADIRFSGTLPHQAHQEVKTYKVPHSLQAATRWPSSCTTSLATWRIPRSEKSRRHAVLAGPGVG